MLPLLLLLLLPLLLLPLPLLLLLLPLLLPLLLLLLLLFGVSQVTPESNPSQELTLGSPCELCVAAGGARHVRWGKPITVRELPRWHSWQPCGRVLEVDRERQTARVEMPQGPLKQVGVCVCVWGGVGW